MFGQMKLRPPALHGWDPCGKAVEAQSLVASLVGGMGPENPWRQDEGCLCSLGGSRTQSSQMGIRPSQAGSEVKIVQRCGEGLLVL